MNDREIAILKAIIQHYLEYGESVGSRTLEKKYNIGVSSATIRNAMSDLEERGLISKTHTSSGRIPTNEGYKLYIDELVQIRDISKDEKDRILQVYNQKVNQIDMILEETSKLLSKISKYAGIVLEPSMIEEEVKKVELVHINDKNVFMVIVMNNSITKTMNIQLKVPISEIEVKQMSEYLNNQIRHSERIFTISDLETMLLKTGILEFGSVINNQTNERNKVFFEGGTNLIENNISDIVKMAGRVKLLNSPQDLRNVFMKFIEKENYKDREVNIVFGEDLGVPELEDLSFVFSVYTIGHSQGIIGVIGPKRMEYSKTVGLVEYVSEEVNKIIKKQ